MWSWLDGLLDASPSWFSYALLAILLTFLSALFTLRQNIRYRAWEHVYTEKRDEIRRFSQLIDEFASAVHYGWEIRATETDALTDQAAHLMMWARRLKKEFDLEDGGILDQLTGLLPELDDLEYGYPRAHARLEQVRQGMLNVVEERLQDLNIQIGKLRTTLTLTARDPRVLEEAHRVVAWAYEEVHQTDPFLRGFDLDSFVEEWRDRMAPIRLDIRRDLDKSSRSLSAAVKLSWGVRLRHSWLGRKWAGLRDSDG